MSGNEPTATANPAPLRLRLPATSANLGPGFDALALALDFYLHVEATPATSTSIRATGRNVDIVQRLDSSLLVDTYRNLLAGQDRPAVPLALTLHNEIPLGMGCGSSAAALVAGVSLASHFGNLGWSPAQILTEAARREGHPDNVAACVLGGLTVSAMQTSAAEHAAGQMTEHAPDNAPDNATVHAVSLPIATPWRVLLAMPAASLSTKSARALLPNTYSKADTIANVQAVALLVAAFATGRGDLLQTAMQDRVHQPFRAAACPLLPALLPLAGRHGILGIALSGAGPSVLLLLDPTCDAHLCRQHVIAAAQAANLPIECLLTSIATPAHLQTV